jgi:hypothetical protein
MIELHLSEKLWEYFVNRSLKDYGLFVVIIALILDIFIKYGVIPLLTSIILYLVVLLGLIIVTIGSIRDGTIIEITNISSKSTRKPKDPIFSGIRHIYNDLKDNPKIRWKVSIRDILGIVEHK